MGKCLKLIQLNIELLTILHGLCKSIVHVLLRVYMYGTFQNDKAIGIKAFVSRCLHKT